MSNPTAIVATMYDQIGSDALWAVSARNAWYDNEGSAVSFEYGRTPNPSRRRITVRYHAGADLYSVVATKMNRKTLEAIETDRYEGVYFDQLPTIIRSINNERG